MKKIILDVFSILIVLFAILSLLIILASTDENITLGLQYISGSLIISVFLAAALFHLFKNDKK